MFFTKKGVTHGKVITNAKNATEYLITSVVADDPDTDLVIVEIERNLLSPPPLSLNISFNELMEAEDVFVISSPLGLKGVITTGIVSAIHNVYDIQISAPISTGSSGAPIFNYNGEVVGVVTGHFNTGQNLNFGISVNGIIEMVQKIEKRPNVISSSPKKRINSPQTFLLAAEQSSKTNLPEQTSVTTNLPEQINPVTEICNPEISEYPSEIIHQCYPTLQQWIEQNMSQDSRENEQSFFYFMQFFANLKNFTKGIWNKVTNSSNSGEASMKSSFGYNQPRTSTNLWENTEIGNSELKR